MLNVETSVHVPQGKGTRPEVTIIMNAFKINNQMFQLLHPAGPAKKGTIHFPLKKLSIPLSQENVMQRHETMSLRSVKQYDFR